ncbi:polygalacturonase-like, partial [Cucurbita moschata]|uniref:Polygalacturonase-like n=1 Tax=Cucurbita moschata TaxID=3662 RepID=A0A6J1F4J0_CUCMO
AELTFNIITLVAKPDEKTDASPVLQTAWAKACDSTEPATIYVPEGIFFVRSVRFNGPCKNNAITVLIDGTLVASSDIQVLANSSSWISFNHISGLSITGGIINGQGTPFGNDSGVKVSEVTYEDIKGTSATEIAIKFDCSPTNHCTGLNLIDINLTYENHIAKASCKNAEGTTSGVVEPSSCLAPANFYPYNIDPLGYS